MGTFNSNSGEQLNACWSFIRNEYEVENRLSWITKIEPEPMMEVSLVPSKIKPRKYLKGYQDNCPQEKFPPGLGLGLG